MSEDCIFCKIVNGQIPSKKVFESDKNIAFLDIRPISTGHTVVIPKKHYSTIETLPDEEVANLFKVVKKVALLLHEKLEIDGYNIVQNNFKAAGQVVEHSHVHVIPRNKGDRKIELNVPKEGASEEELEKVLEKILS
ncbi:MAG: HIT domain-containing protein [Candidatus Lokiarchaeota archaeon]|nr:HIT domain-containing protein [Candidatus Lokiarchaeota archaeon]